MQINSRSHPIKISITTPSLAILAALGFMVALLPAQESPLRLAEPLDSVVADLRDFLPGFMEDKHIPGVSITLIRDGRVAWTEGFGIANSITGQPVTPETLFEVASNSKVITAYIALRLVDQGLLSLDLPLDSYLPEPWLPSDSPYRDKITLRHALSHSSGLGHNTPSRENLFPPGSHYSYSSHGLHYTHTVIEQVTGQPLEDLARELVFKPLDMSATSYLNRPDLTRRTANGHLWAVPIAVLFVIPFVIIALIVSLIILIVQRIRTGRWRPTRRMMIIAFVVILLLTMLPGFFFFGEAGLLKYAWLEVYAGFILLAIFAALFLSGRFIIHRLIAQRPRLRKALTTTWTLLILVGLALLAGRIRNVPAPKWPHVSVGAASSVRATTADMARFLIEIADPWHLDAELSAQLKSPQIWLTDDLAWGLGPGLQFSSQGLALWQWGQNPDFQSVMVIYPEHGFGVVVCTNSDFFNPDVAIDIAERTIGGRFDRIRQGSHLWYDYRPEE